MKDDISTPITEADCSLDDVLINDQLDRRPSRQADYAAENRALADLAEAMGDSPDSVLQKLVETAMEMTGSDSAGISLLEPGGQSGIFRWVATAGRWTPYRGGTMPREASPCGEVIGRDRVLLLREPHCVFPALLQADPGICEGLLAPFHIDNRPVGTVWAIKHSAEKGFEREDARLLTSLANFASVAHRVVVALADARVGEQKSRENLKVELADKNRINLRLRGSEQRLESELSGSRLLQKLSARLIPEQSPEALYDQILDTALELMRADAVSIQLLEQDGQRLRRVATRNLHPDSTEYWTWVDASHASTCGQALSKNERVVVEDVEASFELAGTGDLDAFRASGSRAVQSTPLLTRTGRPIGMISTHWHAPRQFDESDFDLFDILARQVADLIERSQTEAALRESEDKYRTLFERMGQGYAFVELVRDPSGRAVDQRYIDFNPAIERLLGVSATYAIGKLASEVFPTIDPWWTKTFDRVVRQGKTESIERLFEPLNRWFEVHAYPAGGDRFITLYEDITERKRAEMVLRESEERQAFLLQLSDTLRPMRDASEIERAAVRLLGEHLGVNRAGYYHVGSDENSFHLTGGWEREAPPLPQRMLITDFGDEIREGYRAGRTMVVRDTEHDAVSEDNLSAIRAIKVRAWIGVPLVKEGRWVAAVGVHSMTPRDWTPAEISLVEEVGERTWAAVERARSEAALRLSEDRFSEFARHSADTLWIVDVERNALVYLSPAFEKMWGENRARIMADIGRWTELIHPDDRDSASGLMARSAAGEPAIQTYRIIRPDDGETRWIRDTGFPMPDPDGCIRLVGGIAQEVTEWKRTDEALAASEVRWRSLAEGIPQLVWRARDYGLWTWASSQWTDFTGQSVEESLEWGWLDAVCPDDRQAARDAWEQSKATDEFQVEYRVRHAADGEYRWFQTRALPVRNKRGELTEWFGTSTDIEELRQLQRHQQVLLAELQHRVRNTLAVVRSIARRTAENSGSVDDMLAHFQGRLDAFSRVQAALTRNPDARIELASIIEDELVAHAAREGDQIVVKGPTVWLEARQAERISLAIHELTTNAVKYGALRTGGGKLRISWEEQTTDKGLDLQFTWKELATPPTGPRSREGFGVELLTRSLPYDLRGRANLEFGTTGLTYELRMPLRHRR